MPSENTGRTITSIVAHKKFVRVKFEKVAVDLTPDRYTDHYLYVGKTLTEAEYAKIDEEARLAKLESYAAGLLAKGMYTRQQIVDKLYKRSAKRWMVEALIVKLVKASLLDDEVYIAERFAYGEARNEGFFHIKNELYAKGIDEERLKTMAYDEENEERKALVWLPKLVETYAGKSARAAKGAIYDWYLRHGFPEVVIGHIIASLPEMEKEEENIRHELANARRKYGSKYRGRALHERLIRYLAQKGYQYTAITKALGEQNDDMD